MLHVHRSHRTEDLVEGLAQLYAQPLDDPMQAERVLVGSRGMERWLATELARRSPAGVLANVTFDFPLTFVERLVDDVLGPPDRTLVDPWSTDALVWTLAGRLPDAIAEDPGEFPHLARYLDVRPRETADAVDDGTGQLALVVDTEAAARGKVVDRKLLGFAAQTADLFDRYALYRPDMVRAWRAGRDVDADGDPLGAERWQALLWRAVASQQHTAPSPADRIAAASERLADGHALSDRIPSRLVGFGLSTLQPLYLELVVEVARQRDVHLYVPSPSPRLWQLGWERDEATQPDNAVLRAAGPVGRHAAHLVGTVATRRGTPVAGGTASQPDAGGGGPAAAEPADASVPTTLLARLQHDVVTDTRLPDEPDTSLPPVGADRSIVFHDGHGAVRQVEALHEELLRRFDADPTLHPRDVVVLTPDLSTYAPLVAAVFADPLGRRPDGRPHGSADGRPHGDGDVEPPTIPVAVADRSAGRGNPVAAVLRRTLALAHARTSGAEVLDLLSTEPVRARFRLTPGELGTVQQWIEDTGVAWARDERDRDFHEQPRRREHTWAAAVDRLLVGVAMADQGARTVGGVVPYDPIEDGQDLDLLDRVTRFLDVVDRLVDLRASRSLAEWAETLGDLLDVLTGPAEGLPWQEEDERNAHRRHRERVDAVLGQLDRANDALGRDVEVRALARWLDGALDAAGGSAGHGTGAVTVAELVPLRAIPFRVVCLLGMDTGRFPRAQAPTGHDLVARDPRPGDRDRRAEDRALFLDALQAARDALVVTWAGRDPVSGREQPPAIPVAELRDAVEAYVGVQGLRERTHVHPVLPTGPSAFDAQRPLSYDRVRLEAARAAHDQQLRPPPFLAEPLPADDTGDRDDDVLPLDQLVRVVSKPAQALLHRLRVARPEDLRTFPETEPLTIDALARWQVGEALLAAAEDGEDVDLAERVDIVLARGRRPAGAVGRVEARETLEVARRMVDCFEALGPREHRFVRADVDGRSVEGRLRLAVGDRTQVVVTQYGRTNGKRLVRAWLQHLVASVALADERPRTVLQCRGSGTEVDPYVLPPLAPDDARRELRRWVDLHDRARRERVPFVANVSWLHAHNRVTAELLAVEEGGADAGEVEALDDFELLERHGTVGKGRRTVGHLLRASLDAAHDRWGREDDDARHSWPERDQPDVRLVWRDLLRWDDLIRHTDVLDLAVDLLRPLVHAIHRGEPEAAELGHA